jgi:TonB family protein
VPPANRESWQAETQAFLGEAVNWSSFRRHARPPWMGPLVYASVLAIIGFLTYHPADAQTTSRRVKNRIEPVYPELAKKNNISGSARVELLITTDGRVKDVKVLGGNPVLVQAVVTAVMKWKYEPAAEESSVVLKFDFASP